MSSWDYTQFSGCHSEHSHVDLILSFSSIYSNIFSAMNYKKVYSDSASGSGFGTQ